MSRKTSDEELELFRQEKLAEEAKTKYSRTDKAFVENRNRMFVLFTAELGVTSYFTSYFFSNFPNNIPVNLYGGIIFGMAYLAMLFSVGILFIFYKSIFDWPSPIGPVEREKIRNAKSKVEILKIITKDYLGAREKGERIVAKRAKILNTSMHIFIVSAIILLTIRIF